MITIEFGKGNPCNYYRITVSVVSEDEIQSYVCYMYTKAPINSIFSALRASVKDSYDLKVELISRPGYISEFHALDTACTLLSRLRFNKIDKHIVKKVIEVVETSTKEL